MPEQAESPIDRPAPPARPRGSESRPAPPQRTEQRTQLPQIPQSLKELVMNVASAKNEIAGDGRKGQEVLEQAGRLQARKRMTEEREVWDKKFDIKRLAKRIWHDGIHQRALYAREKATAQQMMAEGRLQSDIPYQFQREVRAAAQQQVEQNHSNERGVKKLGTRAKDFLKQATLAQRELHRQEVSTMRNLRLGLQYQGVDLNTITDANQKREAQAAINFVNANQTLFNNYRNVLTGDFQATEALAQRLGADMGTEALRTAIGEKKAGQQVEITGELRQFFNDDVIMPLLREGLQNGNIREETLLDMRTRVQDVFMTKRFADWRNGLSVDARRQFDVSLSYGTDVIPMVERLLPQLQGVKDQLLAGENLKNYVNEIVLKANLGTLKAGADSSVGETTLEKWTSRQLTNKRVQELYNNLVAGREPKPLHPNAYNNTLEPSAQRANQLNQLFKLGGGHVSAGLLAGVGIYAGQRFAGMGARMVLPILGGSAVAGGIRAWQERSRYTREVEQHRRETAEGARFPSDAKRRQEMEGFTLPMLNFQDAINPLTQGRQRVEAGNASVDDLARMLGALADRQARISLMNTRGVDLYRTDANTPYDVQKTNLELENARSMRVLRGYFANGQHATELQALSQRFGNINVDPSNIVWSFTSNISEMRRNNIVRGTALDANVAQAFGGSVDQAASIDTREKAMKRARTKAMVKQGGMTFGMAAIGSLGGQEVVGLFERMGHAAGLWGPPRQTAIERVLHIGSEPKTQHFGGTEVAVPGKQHLTEHIYKVGGAKVDVKMPQGLIPKDAHVIQQDHHFFLVNKDGKHLLGMHFDKSGQPVVDHVKGGINIHDLHFKTRTEGGKATKESVHGLWRQYTADTQKEYYGNDTNTPDLNELKFHTIKMGNSVSLVPENMQTSFEHGLIPPSYYVPDVEHSGNMWYSFNLGGDEQHTLTVQAPSHHGILTLNPNDHDPNHTYMTGTGKRIQAGVLAKMILNEQAVKGLGNGDIATELNGHEDVFNLGGADGEAGIISQGTMHDGVFQSFASIHGTGHLPDYLTTPGQPTYHIEITQSTHELVGAYTEKPTDPFPLPFGPWPRRPLEAGEDEGITGPFREFPMMEYYGYGGAAIQEQVKKWLDLHISQRLKDDKNAVLDPYQEAQDYFSRQDPEYRREIEELAGTLPKLSDNAKAIISIPVAGHQEGNQIYQTLVNYTNQTLPKDQFEIQLFVNRPSVDREGRETSSQETLDAIARFKRDYPDFPVTVLEKVVPPDQAKMGTFRKYGTDVALYRHMQRGPDAEDIIIISNDADQKGVAPTYLERFVRKFESDPHAEVLLGQLDWDPEAYAEYPIVHIGTRLFQYLNIIGRQRSGRMVSSGANSAFRGSAYAAIGGYPTDLAGGEDIAIGIAVTSARDDHTRLAYAPGTRLYTSSRRAVDALRSGLPPINQWSKGFSAFDDEVRKLELGSAERINFDDPEQVTKLKAGLEWVINETVDSYEGGERLGKDAEYYKKALGYLGIKYRVDDNKIIITNMDEVAHNLKNYREIAVLQRDVTAGKGGPQARERLRQLRRQMREEADQMLPPTESELPVDTTTSPEAPSPAPIRTGETVDSTMPNILSERLATFNRQDFTPLPNIPEQRYSLAELESSDTKREVGDFVICEDRTLDREGLGNVVAGYNKRTGQVMAFKLNDATSAITDQAIAKEDFVKSTMEDPLFFTYQAKFANNNQLIRAYPMIRTDLEGYIERNGALTREQALRMIIQVGQGVRELHQAKTGHFDVAASNIFIDGTGKLSLGDFDGLVSQADIQRGVSIPAGNIYIKPPEIYEGTVSNIETVDTYEIATLLYQSLTGQTPFFQDVPVVPGQPAEERRRIRRERVLAAHKAGDLPLPDDLPESIKAIIRKGIDPDRTKRYQSMDAMLSDLLDVYETESGIQFRAPEPPPPAAPPPSPEPQRERGVGTVLRGLADAVPALKDRIQRQNNVLGRAQAFFATNNLPSGLINVITHNGTWADVVHEQARIEGRPVSPQDARQRFRDIARSRGSTLTDDELNVVYTQQVDQSDFRGAPETPSDGDESPPSPVPVEQAPEPASPAELRRQRRERVRADRANVSANVQDMLREQGEAVQQSLSGLGEAERLAEAQRLKGQQNPLTPEEMDRVRRNAPNWAADIMLSGVVNDLEGSVPPVPPPDTEPPTAPQPAVPPDGTRTPAPEEGERPLNSEYRIRQEAIRLSNANIPLEDREAHARRLLGGRELTPRERESLAGGEWAFGIAAKRISELMTARVAQQLAEQTEQTRDGGTNTQEAVPAAVEQLTNPNDLLGQVNRGLEAVGNVNGREQTFTMRPDVLASYLQNSEGLFPGSRVSNLNMFFAGNTLHIQGRVDRRVGPMTIPVQLDDVALQVNAQGELELVGEPQFRYERQLPDRVRQAADNRVNAAFSDIDVRLRDLLSQQTPGWEVNGFSVVENNAGSQIGIQFRNMQAEPGTAPLPAAEPVQQPERGRTRPRYFRRPRPARAT